MKKKLTFASLSGLLTNFTLVKSVKAQLQNPALGDTLGNDPEGAASGSLLISQFVRLWRVMMTVGALAVIIFFIWGAFEWLTSGDDAKGAEKARNRIMNAVIGLVILVLSFVIVGFIGELLFEGEFDLLELTIPTADG